MVLQKSKTQNLGIIEKKRGARNARSILTGVFR
jgi:hypothetical protein